MAFRSTISSLAPRVLRASSSSSSARVAAISPIRQSTFNLTKTAFVQQRSFASGGGLSHDQIQERITDVLKSFEKVNPAKLSASSSFTSDLGLDSLDAVEVVMAIEEEFSIEIPDAEADNITTVQQAIDYISKTPEAI